ncbi:MAG: translocation/assembly module TamB domain-containing protein [Deltaproteobacteria bacterium]|nr:translocation/assembly module TamB domain-containing protein [Deltaproteobacteria bacterium]
MNFRASVRWGGALILAVAGLLLGAYLLRGVLLYPHLKKAVVDIFQSDLELHLALGDIRGSLFTSVEITDVQVNTLEPTDTPLDAAIANVRLSYNLIDFLRGIDAFIGGVTITLDRPVVRIDLSRPSSTALPGDAQEAFGGLPEILPRISIHEGQLDLKGDGYGSRFDGIMLSSLAASGKDANVFEIEVKDWGWHLPPLRDGQVEASARVEVAPSGVLVVHQLALNDAVVFEKGQVDLSRLPQSVSFTTQSPQEYGNLTVNGRHDDKTLWLNVAGNDVDLALIEHILDIPELDLTGHVAIETDIRLPYAQPELMRGRVDIRAGAGQWQELFWDRGAFQAHVEGGVLTVSRAEWQGDGNTGRIRDMSLPTAAFFEGQVDQLLAGLTAAFDFSLQNIPPLLTLFGEDVHPAGATVPPHHLALQGRVAQGVLTVDDGRLESGSSAVFLNRLQVDLGAVREKADAANLDAEASFDVPRLEDLAALLPLPPLTGQLQGALVFAGSLQTPRGTIELEGKSLAIAGVRLGDLDVLCRSDGAWLTTETFALRNGNDRLNITGRISLESGQLEKARGVARIQDVGIYANPFLPAEWPTEGELNFQSTIEGTLMHPDIRAAFTLAKSSLGLLTAEMARGRVQASSNRLDIERIELQSSLGDLVLAGRMGYNGDESLLTVDLKELSFQRDDTAMRMSAPVRISQMPGDRWRIAPLVLEGTAGRATVVGDLGWPGPTDMTIDLDGIQSGDWLDAVDGPIRAFSGLVARIHLTGTAASPRIEIEGHLPDLIVRDAPRPLQGRFDLAVTGSGIEIRDWVWNDGADAQLTATGHLPLVYDNGWQTLPGPLHLQATLDMEDGGVLQGFMPDLPMTGVTVQARLDLAGTLASPAGTLQCAIHDLLLATPVDGPPQGPFEAQATLRVDREGVALEELRIDSALMSLQGQGRWRIDEPPLYGQAFKGQLPAGTLTVSADFDIPDLGWLAGMLPGVQKITGRLNGSLNVDGPLKNPAVVATLALREGSLRPEGDAPPLKSLQADLQADTARLTVRSCRGEIGGAPFELSGDLWRSEEKSWVTDFRLTGTNLLLYRTADIRVRADTGLHLTGPIEKMTLKGEIGLTNGRMSRNVDFFSILKEKRPSTGTPSELLFSLPEPPLKDMVFDVRITSRTPFELRNNVIKGGLRPDLHLGGTGELPLLTGDIYVDPTRLRLPAGVMTIQSGVVRFLPSRANRPEMDLLGEGKVFDYDITALIEGPVEEPRVTLSSSPPLPGNELMLMLLTGQPPTANRTATGGVPLNLAVYIGQDLLSQWFAGDSTESWTSILDRFEVTQGRRVTRSGEETLEAQFRIGKDVFRDGDSIYITGEKDIFDFYNAGLKFVFRFK